MKNQIQDKKFATTVMSWHHGKTVTQKRFQKCSWTLNETGDYSDYSVTIG